MRRTRDVQSKKRLDVCNLTIFLSDYGFQASTLIHVGQPDEVKRKMVLSPVKGAKNTFLTTNHCHDSRGISGLFSFFFFFARTVRAARLDIYIERMLFSSTHSSFSSRTPPPSSHFFLLLLCARVPLFRASSVKSAFECIRVDGGRKVVHSSASHVRSMVAVAIVVHELTDNELLLLRVTTRQYL